jgi:hypothetical protein
MALGLRPMQASRPACRSMLRPRAWSKPWPTMPALTESALAASRPQALGMPGATAWPFIPLAPACSSSAFRRAASCSMTCIWAA